MKSLKDSMTLFIDGTATLNLLPGSDVSAHSQAFSAQFSRCVNSLRQISTMTSLLVPPERLARRHFRLKYTDSRLLRWTGVEQWRFIFWILDGLSLDGLRSLIPLAEELRDSLFLLIILCRDAVELYDHCLNRGIRIQNSLFSDLTSHLIRMDEQLSHFEFQETVTRNHALLYSQDQLDCIQEMAITYSAAFLWTQYYGIFTLEQMEESSVEIMVGLPRIALMIGIRILKSGPISASCPKFGVGRYPVLFESLHHEVDYLWRQLWCLSELEFVQLAYCVSQVNQHATDYWVFLPERVKQLLLTSFTSATTDSVEEWKRKLDKEIYLCNLTPIFKVICRVADSLQSDYANANRLMLQAVHSWHIVDTDNASAVANAEREKISQMNYFKPLFDGAFTLAVRIAKQGLDTSFSNAKMETSMESQESKSLMNGEGMEDISEVGVDALDAMHWHESDNIHHIHETDEAQDKSLSRLLNCPSLMECQVEPPKWQLDTDIEECNQCSRTFALTLWRFSSRRRHHCRRCGYLFCSQCWGGSTNRRYLPSMGLVNVQPVCVNCAEVLPPVDLSIKALPSGLGSFSASTSPQSDYSPSRTLPNPVENDNSSETVGGMKFVVHSRESNSITVTAQP